MTSTGTFQGLNTERKSSKVLRPPGGGSSDIFGAGGEEATSPRRIKNHNQSSLGTALFGSDSSTPSTGTTSPDSPRANKPDGNPVTGTGYAESTPSQNGGGSSASSINGDNKSTTDSSPGSVAKPRSRVPPGGYSSGLW